MKRADSTFVPALGFHRLTSLYVLDGFANTEDNLAGRLVPLFEAAGFVEVTQARTFNTLFGTMALYSAVKLG